MVTMPLVPSSETTAFCRLLPSKNGKTFTVSTLTPSLRLFNYFCRAKKYVFLGDRGFQADMPARKYFDKDAFNFASFASDVQYWSGILNSNLAIVSK